jgi:glyoxylase-like metal-dependent hydrolase (beta-lactamase superfamily II)
LVLELQGIYKMDLQIWFKDWLKSKNAVAGTLHQVIDDQTLKLVAFDHIPEIVLAQIQEITKGKGMAGQAFEQAQEVYVCNLATDESGKLRPNAKFVEGKGAIAFPIWLPSPQQKYELWGILGISLEKEVEITQTLISTYSDEISIHIQSLLNAAISNQKHHKIWSILGNSQMLDGGAMFGNAPKALWNRWISADDQNRIPLACRALLIQETSGRLILCEAGIGAFFDPQMKKRFGVQEQEHILVQNLAKLGISPDQIDVIVLSHLHFDHAGGVLSAYQENQPLSLIFKNAHYVIGKEAWDRAMQPHERDRASFIPELCPLLEQTQKIELVEGLKSKVLGDDYLFVKSDGHTPGQLHLLIKAKQPILFCGDLIPGTPWVHLPITMGYDRFPERLIEEKKELLSTLLKQQARLFFTHDHHCAMAEFECQNSGKYAVTQTWTELDAFEVD